MHNVIARSSVGGRQRNEDYFAVLRMGDEGLLVVVADGVGGHVGGDVASKLATAAFVSHVYKSWVIDLKGPFARPSDEEVTDMLRKAVAYANESVRSAISGAGTTIVAAFIIDDVAYVTNVGDSRAYLIHGDEIHQITRDHSIPWREFEEKLKSDISQFYHKNAKHSQKLDIKSLAEFKLKFLTSHPQAHVVWNVVGYFGAVDYIDVYKLKLYCGDLLLLATDGLTDVISDYDILEVVKQSKPIEETLEMLIARAEKTSTDNITIAMVDVACEKEKAYEISFFDI